MVAWTVVGSSLLDGSQSDDDDARGHLAPAGGDCRAGIFLMAVDRKPYVVDRPKSAARFLLCRREIAEVEADLRAGHPDLQGLRRALVAWSAELRLLAAAQRLAGVAPQVAHIRAGGVGLACGPTRP